MLARIFINRPVLASVLSVVILLLGGALVIGALRR